MEINETMKIYLHRELDTDNNFYWFENKDIKHISSNKKLEKIHNDFKQKMEKIGGLYYKGARLYFTFENQKYSESWHFYSADLIKELHNKLKEIGATNFLLKKGELD